MIDMMTREEFLDLIPAYALDALDPGELAAFEVHLAQDAEARRLLAEYEAVAANLAFEAPAHPAPDHLEADLRQRLAARYASPDQSWESSGAPPARTNWRASWRPRWREVALPLAATLAALLVLVVGVLAVLLNAPRVGGPPMSEAARLYAALIAETGGTRYALQPGEVTDRVQGELIAAADGARAVIAVSGLPSIAATQVFQLWLRGADETVQSGGLFRASGSMTYVAVPLQGRTLADLASVGVSLEPAGGSPYTDRPSGPRVFLIPLAPPEES